MNTFRTAMKLSQRDFVLVLLFLLLPGYSLASDSVPFSVERVRPVGAGFLELVGPGAIRIKGKVFVYEGRKFINKDNVDVMTSFSDKRKGCVLAYSSEAYKETISVREQSCNEILSVFSVVD